MLSINETRRSHLKDANFWGYPPSPMSRQPQMSLSSASRAQRTPRCRRPRRSARSSRGLGRAMGERPARRQAGGRAGSPAQRAWGAKWRIQTPQNRDPSHAPASQRARFHLPQHRRIPLLFNWGSWSFHDRLKMGLLPHPPIEGASPHIQGIVETPAFRFRCFEHQRKSRNTAPHTIRHDHLSSKQSFLQGLGLLVI